MMQIILFLFYCLLLAVAVTTGAVFFILFAGIIAASALFIFLYMKITGRLPGGMRIYTFQQHAHREQTSTPENKVIEADYKEIKKDSP
jgi:hypothetical protein